MFCVVGKNVFDGLIIEFCGTRHRVLILTSPSLEDVAKEEGPSLARKESEPWVRTKRSPLG